MAKINKAVPDKQTYLQRVRYIANPPKRLWYTGTLPAGPVPSIAIVGTRKPTAYGREMTYRLSYELARRGVVIISGLALGCDGIAHRAALDAHGMTLAVLPTSIDEIHPRLHRRLSEQIVVHGGALISEYLPGEAIHKSNFVERNRIVSALSDGVLIVEAAARSGTLTTARFALEQGKTVMAVPGNATSPMSIGCNALLRTGATLVTEVADVLHELGLRDVRTKAESRCAKNREEQLVLDLLVQGITDGDELQQKSGLTATDFSQALTMLEISGEIRALGANNWTMR